MGQISLNPMQKRFATEYLIDLNATAAAKRAGYADKSAYSQGQRALKHAGVQELIQSLMTKRAKRTEITQDRVLQEYARLGFFDPRKMFNADGSPKPINELDDDTAAALAGLDVQEVYEGTGQDREFKGYTKKYKISDKKGALDSIARHLGMFNDKLDVTGSVTVDVDSELIDKLAELAGYAKK